MPTSFDVMLQQNYTNQSDPINWTNDIRGGTSSGLYSKAMAEYLAHTKKGSGLEKPGPDFDKLGRAFFWAPVLISQFLFKS